MDLQEVKKDIKHIHFSKNIIIICLSVALVIVSMAAFCLSERGEGGDRYERDGYRMMEGRGYGYDNYGPGYGMMRYGQPVPVTGTIAPAGTTTPPTAPAPKTQ